MNNQTAAHFVNTIVLGVNLTDVACASINGHNFSFDNAGPGPIGDAGAAGVTGPTGVQGVTGGTGGTGGSGAVGNPGNPGAKGPTGGIGGTGPQGPPGGPGVPGADGVTGNQGLIGNDGVQGGTGLPGGLGPIGPTGGADPVILVIGPANPPLPPLSGAINGSPTQSSAANCPFPTTVIGGGGHIGLTGGTVGALFETFPSGNSWVAGAVVTHAAPGGTITGQAYAFCQ